MDYTYPASYGLPGFARPDAAIVKGLAQGQKEASLSMPALRARLIRESSGGFPRFTPKVVAGADGVIAVHGYRDYWIGRWGDFVLETCAEPFYQGPLSEYWYTVLHVKRAE